MEQDYYVSLSKGSPVQDFAAYMTDFSATNGK